MQISTNPVVILFRKWLRLTQEFHELTRRILWYLSFPNQKPGPRCYWYRLRHVKQLKKQSPTSGLHRNSYRVDRLYCQPRSGVFWNLVRPLGEHPGRGLGLDFCLSYCRKKSEWFLHLLSVKRNIRVIISYRRKRISNWQD